MRKIFKLRGEILIIFFIASIFSLAVTTIFIDLYRNSYYESQSIYKNAIERNSIFVQSVEEILETDSKDEELIKNNLHIKDDDLIRYGADDIFLVDNEGNVIDELLDYGIGKLDFDNKEDYFNMKNIRYVAKNVMKVNDNFYVVAMQGNYCKGDMDKITIWLVMSVIIFVILMSGRIKYIDIIAAKVKKISGGNLDIKVPKKYGNELTSLSLDINKMAENLKAEDLKQKEFITNISHDLRTPLTTILGYVKMIEEKKYENLEELEKYISVINRKSIYLKKLIDDFFDYSKLMSKDIKVNMIEVNINECIKELLYEEDENFKEKGLSITSEITREKAFIQGDPMLIGRVFENIISNALKYSKDGSEVLVRLFKENKYIIFTMSNIPKDTLTKDDINNFFNRLYKKDSSRKSAGNGLGLAISKEIVKIHKGTIEAEKDEDKVKFIIKLPLK